MTQSGMEEERCVEAYQHDKHKMAPPSVLAPCLYQAQYVDTKHAMRYEQQCAPVKRVVLHGRQHRQ